MFPKLATFSFLILASISTCCNAFDRPAASVLELKPETRMDGGQDACAAVRDILTSYSFSSDESSEQELPICDSSVGCCSEEQEQFLFNRSRTTFDNVFRETIASQAQELFIVKIRQFDEYFMATLRHTVINFNAMFQQTYGFTYDQNSAIFTQMFTDIQNHYLTGKDKLDSIINRFFGRLFNRIFRIMNPQFALPETYNQCLLQQMASLKPFGNVPATLSADLRRAFSLYGTFVQGLKSAKFVLGQLIDDSKSSSSCASEMTRMNECSLCSGHPAMRTCFGLCAHVMKQCLTNYVYLEPDWNAYVDAMLKIARELEGSFSLEATLGPINVKVSEAIMNFQENGVAITQRVFAACGQMSIRKREIKYDDGGGGGDDEDDRDDDDDRDDHTVEKSDRLKGKEEKLLPPMRRVTTAWNERSTVERSGPNNVPIIGSVGTGIFERDSARQWKRVVSEVRKRLIGLRRYWSKLPRNLCSDDRLVYPTAHKISTSTTISLSISSKRCWNGTDAIDLQAERIPSNYKKISTTQIPRSFVTKRTVLKTIAMRLTKLTDVNYVNLMKVSSSTSTTSTTAAPKIVINVDERKRVGEELGEENEELAEEEKEEEEEEEEEDYPDPGEMPEDVETNPEPNGPPEKLDLNRMRPAPPPSIPLPLSPPPSSPIVIDDQSINSKLDRHFDRQQMDNRHRPRFIDRRLTSHAFDIRIGNTVPIVMVLTILLFLTRLKRTNQS